MRKKILSFFIFWKVIVYLFVYLATLVIPQKLDFTPVKDFGFMQPYFFWIWGNFDGVHYLNIARNGYFEFEHPFFPLYPLVIKITHSFFILFNIYTSHLIIGIIISNLFFIFSLYIVAKLISFDNKNRISRLVLLTIVFFPTSAFYGAVYNDSLFFLLATITIYFARRKKFLTSCIFGALSTLARLNGLALCFIILFEYLISSENIKDNWNFKQLGKQTLKLFNIKNIFYSKIFFITLIPLAFIGYLIYTHLAFGNWNYVFTSMQVWNQQQVTFPLQVLWRYTKIALLVPSFNLTYLVAMLELFFVIFYIAVIVFSYKKIRFSYWLFIVISILIPSLTGTFQGMPRYGLHVYPLFLAIALFLENKNKNVKTIYFIISAILMFIFVGFFTRGYFVS